MKECNSRTELSQNFLYDAIQVLMNFNQKVILENVFCSWANGNSWDTLERVSIALTSVEH